MFGTGYPLRRHSYSEPTGILDACFNRVGLLSLQIDRVYSLGSKSRSKSQSVLTVLPSSASTVVPWILEDILDRVTSRMHQCHHCHRNLDHPDHRGIKSGVNHCTLDHFEGCPGGHQSDNGWTGCPTPGSGGSRLGDGMNSIPSTARNSPGSGNKNEDEFKLDVTPDALAKSLQLIALTDPSNQRDTIVLNDTDDEEDMHIQEEIKKLQLEVAQKAQAMIVVEEQARKQKKRLRREKLEKQRAELLEQSKALQLPQSSAAQPQGGVGELVQSQMPSLQPTPGTLRDRQLKEKADELAAKQTERSALKNRDKEGLTIAGIRALPGMTKEIEKWITSLQASVPSLAKTPTVQTVPGVNFQPPDILTTNQHTEKVEEIDQDFVYSASRGKLVRVIRDSPGTMNTKLSSPTPRQSQTTAANHTNQEEDTLASEDEDCTFQPPQGYKLAWYRDSKGHKYFLPRPVKHFSSPQPTKNYVRDKTTGRWYEQALPKETVISSNHPTPNYVPRYMDHRVNGSSPIPQVSRGIRTPGTIGPHVPERVPQFLQGDPDTRQGKDSKMPELVQWARNCPVSWTKKITSDKLNAVLWAWAYISELLATRTGQAPNLQPGELEARLQHFCNVLEVTLQSSSQSDFSSDAWNVARLYDQKVQQRVDSNQFSWVQLNAMNHGASHPHELMAAHQELAKKAKAPTRISTKEDVKQEKRKCGTWNKSDVRGKCTYEVENPGEKCKFTHECSYCKSKSLKPVDHQRSFCRKRTEEEG